MKRLVASALACVAAWSVVGFTQSVTYTVSSTHPQRPTLIRYQGSSGEEVYDSLNWGNLDGDTLPWVLTLNYVGTPHVRAQDTAGGRPILECSIAVNGVVVVHRLDIGVVDCMVGQ